ncbi:MAG: 2-C-methyl-D-erythritol 4-phosphate cytidylyltransferase [bacterium]|nr:2-C-methyl-D-erythritol 4-phosphate cytidylyltransferase [bacterium]
MLGRVFTAVPAAGSGIRMGLGYSKSYADVAGRPVLAMTLEALLASPFIDQVTVAVRPGEEDLCRREVLARFNMADTVTVIAGGLERQHTVQNLLAAAPPERDLVLIHDGARPLVSTRVIRDVIEAAVKWGGAIAAVPMNDTVKESVDGGETVASTVDRSTLYRAQTPQAFHRDLISSAHRRALKEGWDVTDDASLLEQMGHSVRLVEGDERNFKVTTLDDLELLRMIIQAGGHDAETR